MSKHSSLNGSGVRFPVVFCITYVHTLVALRATAGEPCFLAAIFAPDVRHDLRRGGQGSLVRTVHA